ncbi:MULTISPECIES: c-type cytochrome [Chromobacterium]|uniref:Cytochrome c n=2 Tax=Chromobacterium TaxID=535 RepID=A0ABS3GS79_9NEIS|nr:MULTISPECIES: cytochrome c [Chromobacterium]AXT45663.1 cytochrome c [Chromobacterium rhizoryzae]MBK0416748.1 cytochrome c [Chromobacterium haemolyticum]MBO0417910.1 cytochrome c [Chromobacterium haemolyticum]MBO0501135.1 cytochrome c [Chromobacterium haemolyticum]MDH0343633.1 cytochrome c [Chromobacterium haemolyticum]
MKKLLTVLLLGAIAAPLALADTPAETRTKSFKKVLLAFEPMGTVVRGRDPYQKDAFIRQADALSLIAAEPFNHFPANSISGKSRAKPEIWSQPAKFQADKDAFLKAVADLRQAARGGDLAAIKKNYGAVAQSCKSCHDAFRGPEK